MPQGDIFVYDCFTGESNFYDNYYPASAEFLTFVSFFFLIIKYL